MAIKTIRENKTFEFLDEDLRQLASFREENPDASLTALGNSFDPPVSRSSVNYKFKKLREFAKKTRKQILAEMENQQR